jgi:hypothetical protein
MNPVFYIYTKFFIVPRAHKPGYSRPRKPPTLQHHGCPADKGGFSWAAYGNNDTGRTGQARHGKSEYPYLQDKSP